MSESNKGVSLLPGDAQEGGYLDDADVTFKSVRAATWDYRGKAKPCAAIEVTFITPDDREKQEYYRVGPLEKLVPSNDGEQFLPVGGATGIMAKSKGFYLITSIINAGFPADKVATKLSVFNGLRAHVNNTTLPEKIKDDTTGQEKDNKAILVTKILAYPWENKAAAKGAGSSKQAAAASTASAPAASSPAADDAVSELAVVTVARAVQDAGGSLGRVKLNQGVFKALANDPHRNAVVRLVGNKDFLKGLDGQPAQVGEDLVTLQSDGETVSIAA